MITATDEQMAAINFVSGRLAFAEDQNTVEVNKDDLRTILEMVPKSSRW